MSAIPKSLPVVRRPPPQQQAAGPVASSIAGTIQRAARQTGASFEYLLATAKVESNLNPNLKAKGSSATGLFQFIEQTWLGMMKGAGRALGFGNYADAITRNSSGRYQVADTRLRNEILQLRKDAAANAAMAGAFTQRNAAALGQRIRRVPTDSELYIAHFFGTAGAAKLIDTMRTSPQTNAATMFPNAARANRSIFYDRQGQARTVAGVHAELDRRYQVARANVLPGTTPTAVAQNATTPAQVTSPAPDTAGTARVLAAAQPAAAVDVAKPDFRSLFHTGEVRGAVAPVVADLWRAPVRVPGAPPASGANPAVAGNARAVMPPGGAGAPLDLFQEARPDMRGLFTGRRA
jgi:hypothetical protein